MWTWGRDAHRAAQCCKPVSAGAPKGKAAEWVFITAVQDLPDSSLPEFLDEADLIPVPDAIPEQSCAVTASSPLTTNCNPGADGFLVHCTAQQVGGSSHTCSQSRVYHSAFVNTPPLPSVTRSFDKAALPRYGFSLLLLSRSPSDELLRLQQRLPCPALLTCRSASCLPFTAQPVHSARLPDPLGPPVHKAAAPPPELRARRTPGGRLLTLSASFCRPPASPRRK